MYIDFAIIDIFLRSEGDMLINSSYLGILYDYKMKKVGQSRDENTNEIKKSIVDCLQE